MNFFWCSVIRNITTFSQMCDTPGSFCRKWSILRWTDQLDFSCSEIEIEISRDEYDISEDAVVICRDDMKTTDIFAIKSFIKKNNPIRQSQQSTESNFGRNTYMVEKVSVLVLLSHEIEKFRGLSVCIKILSRVPNCDGEFTFNMGVTIKSKWWFLGHLYRKMNRMHDFGQ